MVQTVEISEPGLVWHTPQDFQDRFHPSDDCGFGGHACSGTWHILETVREDERYEAVKLSLETEGWIRPLPWHWTTNKRKWGDERPVRELLDGHNRASAAVELGILIPLVQVSTPDAVADDSGRWRAGDDIPRTTLDAMYDSSQQAHPHPWAEKDF